MADTQLSQEAQVCKETFEGLFHQYQTKYKQRQHELELAARYSQHSQKTLMECRNITNKIKPFLETKFTELFGLDHVEIYFMSDNMACFQFNCNCNSYCYEVHLKDCDICDILSNSVRFKQVTYDKDIFYDLYKLHVGEEILRDIWEVKLIVMDIGEAAMKDLWWLLVRWEGVDMKEMNNISSHSEDKPYDAWAIVILVVIAFVCICFIG